MDKSEVSKSKLLEAATQHFAKNGYDQTSVRQICETANVNLALVSYYFGSKEKLYQEVLNRWFTESIQDKFVLKEHIGDPKLELERFLHTFLQLRHNDLQFQTVLKHELVSDNHERKTFIGHLFSPFSDYLIKILESGRNQNVFHYSSLENIYNMIISILIYPATDSLLLKNDESDFEQQFHLMMNFIFNGLQR